MTETLELSLDEALPPAELERRINLARELAEGQQAAMRMRKRSIGGAAERRRPG